MIMMVLATGCGPQNLQVPTTSVSSQSSTAAPAITCPSGTHLIAGTNTCIDNTWDGQAVPLKSGTYNQAMTGCALLGRNICTVNELLQNCATDSMPGGSFWGKEKIELGTKATRIDSCANAAPDFTSAAHAYLCCRAY